MWRDPKDWSHLSRLSESGQKQKDTFSYYDVTLRQLVESGEEEGGSILGNIDTKTRKNGNEGRGVLTKNITPFDQLFLRKFSQLGSRKCAFHVLLLVKIFLHKLKYLIRCP